MKIYLINDNLAGGGKERRLVQLMKILCSKGVHDVRVAILESKKSFSWKNAKAMNEKVDYPEVFSLDLRLRFFLRRWGKDPFVFFQLFLDLLREKPDVINVWSFMGAVYVLPIAIILRIPLVVSYVADCNSLGVKTVQGRLHEIIFKNAAIVTGNSLAGLRAYGAPKEKSVVIYNGFDWGRLGNLGSETQVRAELGISTPHLVTMVARFDPSKNWGAFIKVACEILDVRDDVAFVGIGEGEDLGHWRDAVPEKHRSRILFPGRRNDVESILSMSTVSLLFTNISLHREGVSNSILESMACGVPVIANDAGGTPEIVVDGVTGFLLESGEEMSSVPLIQGILDGQDGVIEMKSRCVEMVGEKFSIGAMERGFFQAYNRAING